MNPYIKIKNKIKNELSLASYADTELDVLSMWIDKTIVQSLGGRELDYDSISLIRETLTRINVCYESFNAIVPTTLDDADLDAVPSTMHSWFFDFDNASWSISSNPLFELKEELLKRIVNEGHFMLFGSFIESIKALTLPENKFELNLSFNSIDTITPILKDHMEAMKHAMGITTKGYSDFVILTSPRNVALMQSCKTGAFKPPMTIPFKGPNNTMTVGTYCDATVISTYVDTNFDKVYIIYKNPDAPVVEYRPATGLIYDIAAIQTGAMMIKGSRVNPDDFKFISDRDRHAFRSIEINLNQK